MFWKEKQLVGTNAHRSTLNKHSPQIAKLNGFGSFKAPNLLNFVFNTYHIS
jgi:hypothetical protein